MQKLEIIAIILLCTFGCLLVSAFGLLIGWTGGVKEAVTDWLSMSFTTSVIITIWTYIDKRKKKE